MTGRVLNGLVLLGVAGLLLASTVAAHDRPGPSPAKRGTIRYCREHGAGGYAVRACIIRVVFAPVGQGNKAVAVAWCESRFDPRAMNGQYQGMFQMGSNERTAYGFGSTPESQARAALRLWRTRGWQPWACA